MSVENIGRGANPTALPAAIENIPVVPKVTGMFKAYSDPTSRFVRPVPIGVSTGHPDITAGTIGCRVKDADGNVYALSNNHVYANSNDANTGDNVLQPGPYDGGTDPGDAIGQLYDFEEINFSGVDNYMDAAIAKCSSSTLDFSTPSDGYGTPSATTVSASLKLPVQKYGRTTGWTNGEIAEINVTVTVCYESRGPFKCVKAATFVDQITVTPGEFSDGGDSGSLIVTDDENKNPVALLFAGSTDRTIGSPIDPVLSRFNVTIDDGSGGSGTTNNPPTAVANGPYSGTEDVSITFSADGSTDPDEGDVLSYTWDFGDDNSVTTSNVTVSHTYLWGGSFTVTLTVSDGKGGTDTEGTTASIAEVNDAPEADPNGPYSGAAGIAITFDGSGSSDFDNNDGTTDNDQPLKYSWDFDDGYATELSENNAVISHTYAAAGTYNVTLNVSDGTETVSAKTSVTVTEQAVGVTVTGISPNTTQSGTSTDVTISGTGFAQDAGVTFENGDGPAPAVSIISQDGTTIYANVSFKSGGPPKNRYWDVRVTNPDGTTGVLEDGFTVTP
jgi:PKD repeat protein